MNEEALLQAIDSGDIDRVYEIIMNGMNGMNLNFANGEPLKRAMISENYEILKLLILNGADIFYKSSHFGEDAAFFAQQIDDEIDELSDEDIDTHPYIIYVDTMGYDREYTLSEFIFDLDQEYIELLIIQKENLIASTRHSSRKEVPYAQSFTLIAEYSNSMPFRACVFPCVTVIMKKMKKK